MTRPQGFDEDSEQLDSQDVDTDLDAISRADSFSLEFAASQWQRLVSNAEGLFVTLCKVGVPIEAKEQIQQWLFMKQECEDCFANDGSIIREREAFALGRIDEVTESESKSSVEKTDSETEYSDSGAEIDDAVDLSQVETKRHDFAERLEVLMEIFRNKTDAKVAEHVGPITPVGLPTENPRLLVSTSNILKNQRRKSILPSSLNDNSKLPISESTKKEFDLQSSLSQSKNKIKKFLRQLRKDDDQSNSEKDEELKRSKDKCKKSAEKVISKEDKKPAHKNARDECLVEEVHKNTDVRIALHCNVTDDKILRDEITNLRITRDFLVEQRKSLDVKLNRDRSYTNSEQRRFIELDEAIEAIDATIEFKNGSICGRKSFEDREREEGEQMLLDRLMKLTEAEMRSLLFKYFQKTVDLREWGRKLEQEISELDHKIEAQNWKIQTLSGALQQANAENERRLVMVHREHEEKLHLLFRDCTRTGTGTSSSADTRTDEATRALLPPSVHPAAIPPLKLRGLPTSSPHTTKVTRQKNKLIIQRQHK